MREIKFRAWAFASKKIFFPDNEDGWELQQGILRELPNTVLMQFTSLKDKNGHEIYEGDIVECYDRGKLCDIGTVEYGIFESFHEGGYSRAHCHIGFFVATKEEPFQALSRLNEDIKWNEVKVIGNIYENPELLEWKGEKNG